MYFKEEECINPFETLGPRRDAFGNLVEEKKDEEDTSGSALSQLLGDDNIATEEDKVEEVVEEKPIILDFAGLADDIKYNQENRETILKQRLGMGDTKKFNPPSMEVGEAPKKTTRKKKTDKDADGEEVNEREQVDFYEKRFSKPLNRVQSIIDELDIKKDKMEAEAEEMREISKKARNGAILEYLGKTESNIIDTLKTKLAAVKEEVNINTKISELELKKAKDKADASGANNTDAIMSKIYANIAGGTSPAQQMQQTNPQVFQGSMSMNDIYDTMVSDDGFFSPQAYASDDIRVDVFRSSGAGGQHVNKTSSAVRLTHIPTGIVVACQTQRSQFQNKDYAMKMLVSKLIHIKEQEHRETINDLKGVQMDIAWGSQIRSYVFCPYTLVKDHRTNYEIGDVQKVMDGYIDPFIFEYLKYNKKST